MSKLDIPEENLHCHHILFIKDVVDSTFVANKSCFKTKCTRLSYRKARLNGIIAVAQKSLLSNKGHYIWLDDGTSVIRVILPPAIIARKDAFLIEKGASITVFGMVQRLNENDEIALQCNGFKVDEDGGGVTEIYHWLKAIADRPHQLSTAQTNMFYSISSVPSPTRLLRDNFMASPLRDFNTENTGYLWSPDHAFATSTPLRAVIKEEEQAIKMDDIASGHDAGDDDFDDDDFDSFGEIDLVALETDAIQHLTTPSKRKFSLSMD